MTIERICRIESIERQANVDYAAIRAGRGPSEDAHPPSLVNCGLRNAQAAETVLTIADARARVPLWIMILRIFLPVLSIQWPLARPSVVNRCMESTLKQNRQPVSVGPGSMAAV